MTSTHRQPADPHSQSPLSVQPEPGNAATRPTILDHSLTATPAELHLIGGRYRMNARIGKGRLGEIFAATDERFEKLGVEQLAAVQIIPESVVGINKIFNKLSLGYTMLKASAHPNIVNCLQFGRDGKFGFLAMELLEGASLRVVLDSAETLPPDEVKPVIRGVGAALGHLHAMDIVHGNLTTSNVFVGEDLKARLLDVVPLDSDDAIFRGAAMSKSFGRCTVQDDVFGLACLAYEMLSGKHPFNYCPPDEARLAGLKADRIALLTDDEWDALRRALSFERAERTSSVTDFMRDFGIMGTERLRPVIDEPVVYETDTYVAVEEATPAPIQAVEAADPFSWNVDGMPDSPSRRREGHALRTAFLGIVLAGLVAWSYYGQPEELFTTAIGYVDETMDLGLVSYDYLVLDVPIAEPVQPVLVQQPELEQSDIPVADLPVAEPEVIASPVPEPAASPVVEAATPIETPLPVETTTDMLVVDPVVSVSERDAAARIPLRHNTNSSMQLTWWTREGTAVSDQDFIAGEQRIVTGASLGDDNILLIPLINDSVPESQESFFVNLELRNTENGKVEQFATVRVDIIDDDRR